MSSIFSKKFALLSLSFGALSLIGLACNEPKSSHPDESIPSLGFACDPATFVEMCNFDDLLYCDSERSIVQSRWCQNSCATFDGVPKCTNETCTDPNEVISDCSDRGDYSYKTTSSCSVKDDDGNLYYSDEVETPCSHSCSNGECTKIVDDEFTSCDGSTFEARCENNNYVICENGVVTASECGSQKCVILDMSSVAKEYGTDYPYAAKNHYPICVTDDDALCSTEGKSVACEEMSIGGYVLYASMLTSYCVPAVDGSANYKMGVGDGVKCEEGCSDDKMSCRESEAPADKGTACDPSTFENRCENNYAVTCNNNVVETEYCASSTCAVFDLSKYYEASGTSYSFGKDNIAARCALANFDCIDADQTSLCTTVSAFGTTASYLYTNGSCIKTVDGTKSYFFTNTNSTSEICNSGCNAAKTACAE